MATTLTELQALRDLLATPETPELGPGPRAQVQSLADLNQNLDRLCRRTSLPSARRELLRCAILLWHDHHEAAHEICQQIETPDGSWLHGILHRREPDYGNARYWFRRVGPHPGFPALAERVAAVLSSRGERELASQLLPRGQWDPFAFVAECEQAAEHSGFVAQRECLRQIQATEFEVLVNFFWNDRTTSE